MKVTAFVGSARKKHTYDASLMYLEKLRAFDDIDIELICLSDYKIGTCSGCKTCLDRGEELCPLKDDRDFLIKKMRDSDGVIFASPNYSFNVSGQMKIFLDRLAFCFHRPEFFGKTFTGIVAQGVYGANTIIKYFNFIGRAFGFNVVKGLSITTLEPMIEKRIKKNSRILEKSSRKFYKEMKKSEFPVPSLFELMIFRMSRSSMKKILNEEYRDYNYYMQKGWFQSDYYYPVKLNMFKKALGKLFDVVVTKTG